MTGNRWYNQIFKYWLWQETQVKQFLFKRSMSGRKIMTRIAKRRLKQLTKKEIENERNYYTERL